MARDKYEISLWEDYMVDATSSIPAHFEEKKVVVIGSNTMTAACRAYESKLVENINGTNTFTFKMFYTYRDEQTGEKRQNPFLNLLVNERKVKVLWKNKWYDLVIKNIQEDSNGKSITYTCKDLFINELSKNGFNLEFDNELENNQGTVTELAARVLEGTEWQLDGAGSDSIKQEKEEPLYTAISKAVTARNQKTGENVSIPSGEIIYLFYSSVINKSNPCQFLYDETQQYKRDTNSQLIIDIPCFSIATTWTDYEDHPSVPNALTTKANMGSQVSDDFRGSRLVDSQKTVLDPVTDKYVKVYTATSDGDGYSVGDEIYGYESTEYKDATFVNSLIVNSKDFASTNGWICADNIVGPFQLYPKYTQSTDVATYSALSYLKFQATTGNNLVYNSGLRESSSYIPNGIQNGEVYIFRVKARGGTNEPSNSYLNISRFTPHIYKYRYNSGNITIVDGAVDYISTSNWVVNGNWCECTCKCTSSFSRNQVYSENIGLFFTISGTCWVEDIQFFPYVTGEKVVNAGTENSSIVSGRINPGEMDWSSLAVVRYHYYNHTTHQGVVDIDDYLYVGDTDWPDKPLEVVSNDFAKVRSITAKQSNRFNLLQTLAETFECWCQFEILHDNTGRVIYVNGKPQKFVRFKEKIGTETGLGFIYGIDLKTISRTIQSDQIVTKTIVAQNNNEFATNGFCTIARSEENYARDTFILNFDYYITQKLLDGSAVIRDLYSWFEWKDSKGHQQGSTVKGYYTQLRELNLAYDEITDLLVQKKTELTKQESYKTVYENYLTSLQQEKTNLESRIMSLAAKDYIVKNQDFPEINQALNAHQNCDSNIKAYQAMLDGVTTSINNLSSVITARETEQKSLEQQLRELNWAFYKKYAHYIQEGSWINEDYIDDTLYYLDAQSVAYTSSRPQISYNISVARLSSLEEFKSKVFHLGDISYIQDTEFFGYIPNAIIPTPYKEKVLISEVTSNFDDPVQDTFKVQNYKTQFEDLFQRITATTQSLQYASGEYNRAANIVDTSGNIKPETLQDSIAYNNNLVIQANNEQILQDSTGITVTDATNPNNRTKITSGGVFISTDGGATWKNAIRGEGIATQYLTAGNINTQYITLLDGAYPTFRWDSTGINAYYQILDNQGHIIGINLSKAVRFDQCGIYGIDGINGDAVAYKPEDEDDIWENAKFGMTWKGFFLKNKYGDHYIEISSTDDIQVVDTSGNTDIIRVKIGDLGNNVYGFRLKDGSGTTTLETITDGTLWLKDKLYIGTSDSTNYQAAIGYLPLVTNSSQQVTTSVKQKTIIGGEPTYSNITINLDTQRLIFGDDSHDDILTSATLHRTIDIHSATGAESKFVVWEDGTMYAKDGYFEGTINATNGYFKGTVAATDGYFTGTIQAGSVISEQVRVGNVTMGDMANSAYKTVISSSSGMIFKNGSITTILTATLYKGASEVPTNYGTFVYKWYKGDSQTVIGTSQTYTLTNEPVENTVTYKCIIDYTEPTPSSGG